MISYIILTWNSERYIKDCLESIVRQVHPASQSYEIFVVDNGSNDNTLQQILRFQKLRCPQLKLISLKENFGTTYSRNLALKKIAGDTVVLLDADIEILPGVIGKLYELLVQDVRTGLVAPHLIYSNGAHQKSTDHFPTLPSKILRYFFLKHFEQTENIDINIAPHPVDYAISAFWMMKQPLLDQVGLLDENFFYAPEDVDYCLRIWKTGYRVLYLPTATSIHHAQEISRGFQINHAMIQHLKGLLYLFRKHGYWFRKPLLH